MSNYFYLWFGVWSYWHYQKQHYGVYVFVKTHFGLRSSSIERAVILLAMLPAAIFIVPVVMSSNGTGWMKEAVTDHTQLFNLAGAFVLIAVGLAAAAVAFLRAREAEGPWLRRLVPAATLIFLGTNNWPFFVAHNLTVAAAMVTGGHGFQYIVFMMVFAYQRSPDSQSAPSDTMRRLGFGVLAIVFMFCCGATIWWVMVTWLSGQSPSTYANTSLPVALGIFSAAITGVHYLLDGVLWRLSDHDARGLAYEKYGFLFQKSAVHATTTTAN